MERELIETDGVLTIRVPVLRRALIALGYTALITWVIMVAMAYEAREVGLVTTFAGFAAWLADDGWALSGLLSSMSLFTILISVWGTSAIHIDAQAGTVRSLQLLTLAKTSINLGPAPLVVLQRHWVSFSRFLVILEGEASAPLVLSVGTRASAESIAGEVARITGLPFEERVAQTKQPEPPTWGGRAMIAAGVAMLVWAGIFAFEASTVGTGLVDVERAVRWALSAIMTLGGLYFIHAGRVVSLPAARRHERWLSAATLYFFGALLVNYAVNGFKDAIDDVLTIIADPGFATFSAATDLFFPVAALAGAWTMFRLGFERQRALGLFGYRGNS